MSCASLRFSGETVMPSSPTSDSSSHSATCWPRRSVPSTTRPIASRPEIVGRVEVRDERLQRRRRGSPCGAGIVSRIVSMRGARSSDAARDADTLHRAALAGDGRDDRELDVVIGRVEIEEQLVDLVEDLMRPRVAAVDLVEHDDGGQMLRERLREHVAGLRQRAFSRVDEEHDAVDHRQRPFDLAAEVGVARACRRG